ncbi:DUF5134 domain-containing protein [Actinoplanes sp. CA-142083]|uniref:DUF5134 domain-containing protein n=1 Tax=Actinoplanes sp. CA-142083 TaxID=3239903 RepID=UPI003D8DC811
MIGLESLRWSLTLAFAVATGFHLARVLRPGGGERVTEALHLLMGGSMIVMIWPWGTWVPPGVWAVGFTISTGWFVTRAIRATGGRLTLMYFATAAAAMVWMSASMPEEHHLGHATMPGMSAATGYPAWISAALGAYLVAAALWWIARGMRLAPASPHGSTPHWAAVCHGMMSAAMGLSLLAMA